MDNVAKTNKSIRFLIHVRIERVRTSNSILFVFLATLKGGNPSNWPGENGEAYLPPANLQDESKRRFPENMFDIAVSDKIALNRAMPDIRNDQ